MGIEKYREQIAKRIQQAITQSGVDVSTIPAAQLAKLVDNITTGMLFEMDAVMEALQAAQPITQPAQAPASTPPAPAPAATGHDTSGVVEEVELWRGRPFISIAELYVVTNERVRFFSGLLGRTVENIELIRLRDIDYTQGVSERMLGIGDIMLQSADETSQVFLLRNVRDPEKVQEIVRRAWLEARKRHGVMFRDVM